MIRGVTPFRTGTGDAVAPSGASEVVRDAVSQMVRQFADPLAFYRELVQNSIDAGATGIDVRVSFEREDPNRGTLRIVVQDDGCGMDLEIIERCLLVLFRSSKDRDPTKIGKFGVGFFSVFAIAPSLVLVDTSRGGPGHRVRLLPDHSYEIEEGGARKGTSVSIRVPMETSAVNEFIDRSLGALERWCPHVEVPLTFGAERVGPDGMPAAEHPWLEQRIDRPFDIAGEATIVRRDAPGTIIAVAVGAPPHSAFYKRGILLYATSDALVPGVAFKAQHSGLGHTLSRDNVRRDRVFDDVVRSVSKLASAQLADRVVEVFNERVDAYASADAASRSRTAEALGRVAAELTQLETSVPPKRLRWPLLRPDRTTGLAATTAVVKRNPGWSRQADELTTAASRAGVVIIDAAPFDAGYADMPRVIARVFAGEAYAIHARFARIVGVSPRAISSTVQAWLESAQTVLAARGVHRVALGDIEGAARSRLVLAVPRRDVASDEFDLMIEAAECERSAFGLRGTRAVVLNRAHPFVIEAMNAAVVDNEFAAAATVRVILLLAGRLDVESDEALVGSFLGDGSA